MSQRALPCNLPPPKKKTPRFGPFFARVSSAANFFLKDKVDFVGDIRIGTHRNVILRHNHSNPISTRLTLFDNMCNLSFYRFH